MKTKFFDRIIRYCFYALFFITPLLFNPLNYELFEFPKMIFLFFISATVFFAWLGKIISQKRITIKKTPLDIPIILYLLSNILSTILSIHPYTSFWGYYSRSHGGLLSIICYIFLYYAFINNIDRQKSLSMLYFLLFSSFLTAFYGILERFGIDKHIWVQDVQARVFSTFGQPNWLGAFLCAVIFIPLGFILKLHANKKPSSVKSLTINYLLLFTFFFCLVFTNSKSAILAFWISFSIFSFFTLTTIKNKLQHKLLGIIIFLTMSIYILIGANTYQYIKKLPDWINIFQAQPDSVSQTVKKDLKYPPKISESSQIRQVVWKGALKISNNYPLFGSGLETFAYSYYRFKPQQHNLLSEWDFLYNKAHNEFLNILACQGIFGFLSYLSIIGSFLYWSIKTLLSDKFKKNSSLITFYALFSGFLSLLITNFFGFSVVMTGLLFFMIPAFCFQLYYKNKTQLYLTLGAIAGKQRKRPQLKRAVLTTFLIFLLFIYFSLLKIWQADYRFALADKAYQKLELPTALFNIQKSVSLRPREARYRALLAKTAAKLAVAYADSEDPELKKISSQSALLAEQQINTALKLNPVYLNIYKNKTEVFLLLSYFDDKYQNKAIETLWQAVELAPTDAKLFYNIGTLYNKQEKTDQAIDAWEKTIDLKPNYTRVYLNLAEVYKKTDQHEKAKQKLKFVLENIDPDNQKALEEIENYFNENKK